jgi:hypothetical protein
MCSAKARRADIKRQSGIALSVEMTRFEENAFSIKVTF